MRHKLLRCSLILLAVFVAGCASEPSIQNQSLANTVELGSFREHQYERRADSDKLSLILSFSGGGLRAAAFSYGVIKALEEETVMVNGRAEPLSNYINLITSVSGGSFTAAYYGLYGKDIFNQYETKFLRENVESHLKSGLMNPVLIFDRRDRSEASVRFLDKTLFHGAKFDSLRDNNGPLVIINASDLEKGVRFSFIQEYFNLLCSDLNSFSVSRAVVASAAVPIFSNPVVLENYDSCTEDSYAWLGHAKTALADDFDMSYVLEGLSTYEDKQNRKYIHLVDGGITDNLGLRSIYDVVNISGGPTQFAKEIKMNVAKRIAIIVVDASVEYESDMGKTMEEPGVEQVINGVTDAQLRRYTVSTLRLLDNAVSDWASELSTPIKPVTPYFVHLNFRQLEDAEQRHYLNSIPTNLNLQDEQVDALISAAKELLLQNPQFKQLTRDMRNDPF